MLQRIQKRVFSYYMEWLSIKKDIIQCCNISIIMIFMQSFMIIEVMVQEKKKRSVILIHSLIWSRMRIQFMKCYRVTCQSMYSVTQWEVSYLEYFLNIFNQQVQLSLVHE